MAVPKKKVSKIKKPKRRYAWKIIAQKSAKKSFFISTEIFKNNNDGSYSDSKPYPQIKN